MELPPTNRFLINPQPKKKILQNFLDERKFRSHLKSRFILFIDYVYNENYESCTYIFFFN